MESITVGMTKRSIDAIDAELLHCLENINTWMVSTVSLVTLKRRLSKNKTVDADLHNFCQTFIKSYYANNYASKYSNNGTVDSDDESVELDDQPNAKPETKSEVRIEEQDIDDILRARAQEELAKRKDGVTASQAAALSVLEKQEQEEAEMLQRINERRATSEKEMANPPKSEVKFSSHAAIDVDDTRSEATHVTIGEEVVEEEPVSKTPQKKLLFDHTAVSRALADLPGNLHPLLQMQEDLPLVTKEMMGAEALEGKMNAVPEPVVKFKTPDKPPPEINALCKMSLQARERLTAQLYMDAKNNVASHTASMDLSQDKINELIRKETDRLLQRYIDTH